MSTTLPAGTDHALFCYDGQNRLKWLGTTTGNPCGNPAPTGSFGSLNYSQAVSYDALDRLTTGPNGGTYSYSDSAHLHAATSTSSGYTASYDASGNMVCRAPTSTTTCTGGSPTGAKLSYDTESRLAAWQDAYTSPTTTANYLYDGEGQRVAQKVIASGATTITSYVGTLETVTTSGSSTTTTTNYYYAAGKLIAETVNGASTGLAGLTYLVTNYQGSPTEALDHSGVVTASRLYGPYGTLRYSSGAFPTEYGYTGQRADATTGLDYYGARYYDPLLAQFTSADTVMDGFNRYGYGDGNPTSRTDPSGHDGLPDWLGNAWNWVVANGQRIVAILNVVAALIGYGTRHDPPPFTGKPPAANPATEQPSQPVYTPDSTEQSPNPDPLQQQPTQNHPMTAIAATMVGPKGKTLRNRAVQPIRKCVQGHLGEHGVILATSNKQSSRCMTMRLIRGHRILATSHHKQQITPIPTARPVGWLDLESPLGL